MSSLSIPVFSQKSLKQPCNTSRTLISEDRGVMREVRTKQSREREAETVAPPGRHAGLFARRPPCHTHLLFLGISIMIHDLKISYYFTIIEAHLYSPRIKSTYPAIIN